MIGSDPPSSPRRVRRPGRPAGLIRLGLPITVVCAALPGAMALGVSPTAPAPPGESERAGRAVLTTRPEPGRPHMVELPGSFEGYEQVLLHAKVTGYVTEVTADIGDQVQRGQILVALELPEMQAEMARTRAELDAARAGIHRAEAEAELARITYERLARLAGDKPHAVTRQDVDVARGEEAVARARVKSARAAAAVAEAAVDHLEAMMSYATLRAPFHGTVTRRYVHPGALVVAGEDGGEPVLEVVRHDRLRLVLAVPESAVPQTRPGIEAEVEVDALDGQVLHGVVSRCAGRLTPDTRSMRAEIDMDSREGLLRPGMYATVRLHLESGTGGVSIPAAAVHRDAGSTFVWTVQEGAAHRSPVVVARDDGAQAVISGGIGADSLVVVAGPDDLREGELVRVREP